MRIDPILEAGYEKEMVDGSEKRPREIALQTTDYPDCNSQGKPGRKGISARASNSEGGCGAQRKDWRSGYDAEQRKDPTFP